MTPDVYARKRRLRFYQALGAGVDSILSPEVVEDDVILASAKGAVGVHLAEHGFALVLGLTRGLHTALRDPDYRLREPIRIEHPDVDASISRRRGRRADYYSSGALGGTAGSDDGNV